MRIHSTRTIQLHIPEVEVIGCAQENNNNRFSLASEETASQPLPEVQLFPNPATKWVNLQISHVSPQASISYSLYTMTGQLVLQRRGTITERLDLSGLAKGVYLLKVKGEDWEEVKQLMLY